MIETSQPETRLIAERQRSNRDGSTNNGGNNKGRGNKQMSNRGESSGEFEPRAPVINGQMQNISIYAYGVARNRLQQAGRRLHVPLVMTDDFARADAIVTLKNYYRRRPKLIVDAERRGTPVYVLRANTVTQMENFLIQIFQLEDAGVNTQNPFGNAMKETEEAILAVLSGAVSVDLAPQPSEIRRRQHDMASKAQLISESYGKEPQRHVRIFRDS
jgi:hypothetical protein